MLCMYVLYASILINRNLCVTFFFWVTFMVLFYGMVSLIPNSIRHADKHFCLCIFTFRLYVLPMDLIVYWSYVVRYQLQWHVLLPSRWFEKIFKWLLQHYDAESVQRINLIYDRVRNSFFFCVNKNPIKIQLHISKLKGDNKFIEVRATG